MTLAKIITSLTGVTSWWSLRGITPHDIAAALREVEARLKALEKSK